MLIITIYSVLDSVTVNVRSETKPRFDGDPTPPDSSLYHGALSFEQVRTNQDLCEMVADALDQANGYAGDLWDHLIR